jgi:hypothetical protein
MQENEFSSSDACPALKGTGDKKQAWRLREETLVTVAWIAERLQMGSVANCEHTPVSLPGGEKEK